MIPYKIIQKNDSIIVIEAYGERIQLSFCVDIDDYLSKRFGVQKVVEETIDVEQIETSDSTDDAPYRSKKKNSK